MTLDHVGTTLVLLLVYESTFSKRLHVSDFNGFMKHWGRIVVTLESIWGRGVSTWVPFWV